MLIQRILSLIWVPLNSLERRGENRILLIKFVHMEAIWCKVNIVAITILVYNWRIGNTDFRLGQVWLPLKNLWNLLL